MVFHHIFSRYFSFYLSNLHHGGKGFQQNQRLFFWTTSLSLSHLTYSYDGCNYYYHYCMLWPHYLPEWSQWFCYRNCCLVTWTGSYPKLVCSRHHRSKWGTWISRHAILRKFLSHKIVICDIQFKSSMIPVRETESSLDHITSQETDSSKPKPKF